MKPGYGRIAGRIFSSTIPWYVTGYGCVFLFTLLKIPFLTNVFTPAELGDFVFINTLLTYIEVVFFSWITGTIWRYVYEVAYPSYNNLAATALPLLLVLGLLAGISTFILSLVINIPKGNSILVYAFFSSFTTHVVSFFLNYFIFKKWIRKWCFLICFQNVISFLILVAIIVYANQGIAGIFISALACNCILLIFFLIVYAKKLGIFFHASQPELYKKIIPYSSMLIFSNICFTILNNGDRFIIDDYKGKSQLGVYSQNYSLASVGFFSVLQFFNLLFIPLYNKSLVEKSAETNNKIIQLYFLVVTPLLCFFMVNSSVFTGLLLGKEFRGYSYIFNWIAAGIYCFGIANFFEIRLKFLNKINFALLIIAAHALLNILLNVWLLKRYSIETAAIITFGTYCLMMGIFIATGWKFFVKVSLYRFLPDMLFPTLLFISLAILMKQSSLNGWIILLINGMAALFIYFFFLKKHVNILKFCIKKIAY